jgi:ubiquinone/menaquinone biosynthesis C-methylase UbiE
MIGSMPFTRDDIIKLYRSEAEKHGMSGTSTIQDMRTRTLEMAAIFSYLRDGTAVLELGCGNGFVAEEIGRRFALDLDAFDLSQEMIDIAQQRDLSGLKARVTFRQGDVLALDAGERYDLAFSERCIQNLETWDDQQRALANIRRALRPGGEYIMLESFWTGLNNLNAARQELEIAPIQESWHNRFFHEDQTRTYMESIGFAYVEQNCFLSGYYFGSRVLLAALTPEGKAVTSRSILNDYFAGLPPAGDFSPMKILRFRRV